MMEIIKSKKYLSKNDIYGFKNIKKAIKTLRALKTQKIIKTAYLVTDCENEIIVDFKTDDKVFILNFKDNSPDLLSDKEIDNILRNI